MDTLVDMNRLRSNGTVPIFLGPLFSDHALKALSALFIAVLSVGLMGSLPAQGQTRTYASQADRAAANSGMTAEARAPAPAASNATATRRMGAAERVPSVDEVPALGHTISVRLSRASLEHALRRIAAKAGLKVAYLQESVTGRRAVTLKAEDMPAREALQVSLRGTGLRLTKASEHQLVLTGRPMVRKATVHGPATLKPVRADGVGSLRRKQGTITGTITDGATGQPLPGVNVLVEGTDLGAATGPKGIYEITGVEPGTYAVTASFIGYGDETEEGVEVQEGQTTTVDIAMQKQATGLDEVVVVGYGEQQRKDLTGSISTVSAEDIEDLPVTSIGEALNGQAAGVNITQSNTEPGSGATVRIRGIGSISAGNGPLYVVDGFPVTSGNLPNPENISSIEILKDASATAIYGSRGANGVVLVTTKEGQGGEMRVNIKARYGLQQAANKVDVLNAEEFARFVIEGRENAWQDSGGDPSVPITERPGRFKVPEDLANPSELGEGTNWQDELFRTAPTQKYTLSVSGGNEDETLRFYVSGDYTRDDGIVLESDFERFALQANLNAEVSSRFRLRASLSPSLSERSVVPSQGGGALIYDALISAPHLPVYNEDGSYNWDGLSNVGNAFTSMENPVAWANLVDNQDTDLGFLGNVSAEYDLLDQVVFETTLGTEISSSRSDYYRPSSVGVGRRTPPTDPIGTSGTSQSISWLNENTLTYDQTLGESHDLTVLAGFTAQQESNESNALNATNFPNDLVPTLNAGEITSGSSFRSEWALLSLLGRVNYVYDDKYLLTATVRRDGSSRFGEDRRWGTFPSAAASWRLSEEPFMQTLAPTISNLKVRASYGLTGNFSIPNYASAGLLSGADAILGAGLGSIANGLAPGTLPNPDLTWETSRQLDVGLDLGLFGGRLSLTADYYDRVTSDLLLNVQLPTLSGFSNTLRNIGEVRNRGVEFALQPNVSAGDFRWDANFNISFNRNEVLELGPSGDPIFGRSFGSNIYITEIGAPLGSFYGLDVIGVYETQEEVENNPSYEGGSQRSRPGDFQFRDVNGDGEITIEGDRTTIGDAYPDFTFGVRNSFSFKSFGLTLQVDGNYGGQVFNAINRRLASLSPYTNVYQRNWDNRYISPDQPGNGFFQPNRSPTGLTTVFSSNHIEDVSFLRLSSAVLSYQVPQQLGGGLFRNLEVYLAARNVFTITGYPGLNPEVSNASGNALRPGFNFSTYPVARSFSLGVNVGF